MFGLGKQNHLVILVNMAINISAGHKNYTTVSPVVQCSFN